MQGAVRERRQHASRPDILYASAVHFDKLCAVEQHGRQGVRRLQRARPTRGAAPAARPMPRQRRMLKLMQKANPRWVTGPWAKQPCPHEACQPVVLGKGSCIQSVQLIISGCNATFGRTWALPRELQMHRFKPDRGMKATRPLTVPRRGPGLAAEPCPDRQATL